MPPYPKKYKPIKSSVGNRQVIYTKDLIKSRTMNYREQKRSRNNSKSKSKSRKNSHRSRSKEDTLKSKSKSNKKNGIGFDSCDKQTFAQQVCYYTSK